MSDHSEDHYDYDDTDEPMCPRCSGAGEIDCHCGGDLCVCENYGTAICPLCGGDGHVSEATYEKYVQRQREIYEAFRKGAEITKLTSQLEAAQNDLSQLRGELGDHIVNKVEEARAKAINACIKIADNHAVMADSCIEKGAAEMIAVDLRALLHGSTK